MDIETSFSKNETVYTILVKGDFNSSVYREFKNAYSTPDLASAKIVVDCKDTETVDSSALGMILNMQKDLDKADKEITIINCNDFVKKIFVITNFDRKFTIA